MTRLRTACLALLACAGATPLAAQGATLLRTLSGPTGAEFGHAVASGGDVDLDGVPDILVGARAQDGNRGHVHVFSGATGALLADIGGGAFSSSNDYFGTSVAFLGDLDGDGRSEILVGAPEDDEPDGGAGNQAKGYARVLTTANGSTWSDYFGFGAVTGQVQGRAAFGWSVSGGGDVDGDGIPDFAIGAPADSSPTGTASGSVHVFSGSTGGLLAAFEAYSSVDNPFCADGSFEEQSFGRSVDCRTDLTGDGLADVVVGAPGYDSNPQCLLGSWVLNPDGGRVRTFSWSASGATWSESVLSDAWFWEGQLGWAVCTTDGSEGGAPAILAGSPRPSAFGPGRSRRSPSQGALVLGGGVATGEMFGASIAPAADIDHDGVPDVLVGAPEADAAGSNSGRVAILSGATGAELGGLANPGAAPAGDRFGFSLARSGDSNGDGVADVLVGAPFDGGGKVYQFASPPPGAFPADNALAGQPGRPTLVVIPVDTPTEDLDDEPVVVVPKVSGASVAPTAVLTESTLVVFENLVEVPTGIQPAQATSQDFDGDTRLDDVVTVNTADGTVAWLVGQPAGGFAEPVDEKVVAVTNNANPRVVQAAQMNGSGVPDLVVGGDAGVSVLAGTGATFIAGTPLGLSTTPSQLTDLDVADVDGDGDLDVVAASGADALAGPPVQESGFASVLRNDGAGTLSLWQTFANGPGQQALASVLAGDLDNDGDADALLVAHGFADGPGGIPQGAIRRYDNNGAGTFSLTAWPGHFAPDAGGAHPTYGALGDLDEDGFLDALYTSSDNISHPAGAFAALAQPLVVTRLRNDGLGGFEVSELPTAYSGKAVEPILRDVAGGPAGQPDGHLDALLTWYVPDPAGGAAGVPESVTFFAALVGDGAGGFFDPAASQFAAGSGPGSGSAADVDPLAAPPLGTPGAVDLVLPDTPANALVVLKGDGAGHFSAPTVIPGVDAQPPRPPQEWDGGPVDVRLGDLDGDGLVDALCLVQWLKLDGSAVSAALVVQRGDGLGHFALHDDVTLPNGGDAGLADADLDGDLDACVLLRLLGAGAQGAQIRLNNGFGLFNTASAVAQPPPGQVLSGGLALGDVDGDLRPDLVTAARAGPGNAGHALVFRNVAGGPGGLSLAPVPSGLSASWTTPTSVALADLDGDGADDVLVGVEAGGLVAGYNAGGGSFGPLPLEPALASAGGGQVVASDAAAADLNGDAAADLVCVLGGASQQHVVTQLFGTVDEFGLPTGDFAVAPVGALACFAAGTGRPLRPLVADLDGNGAADLVLAHGQLGKVSVLLNQLSGLEPFGVAKRGSGGLAPELTAKGYTVPGGSFTLSVGNALGGAQAWLVVGAGKVDNAFPAMAVSYGFVPLVLGGEPGVPGAGSLQLPVTLPLDATLVGTSLVLQVVVLDPGPPSLSKAASNGLALSVN